MNLRSEWAVVRPDQRVEAVTVNPEIYAQLDANYAQFHRHSLVAMHHFRSSWDSWEIHPHGDEVVVLISGAADLVLRQEEDKTMPLKACGDFVVVPQNTWHTAIIHTPTQMLFITPGEGTRNAPTPPPGQR